MKPSGGVAKAAPKKRPTTSGARKRTVKPASGGSKGRSGSKGDRSALASGAGGSGTTSEVDVNGDVGVNGGGTRQGDGAGTGRGSGMHRNGEPPALQTIDWTRKEQQLLEDGLNKCPEDKHMPLDRYIRIASMLPGKGVRDDALRVRWRSRKEQGKRRKADTDTGGSKKSGSRSREGGRVEKTSIFAMRPPAMPAAGAQRAMPHGAGASMGDLDTRILGGEGIGGTTGRLLGENMQVINQIRHNLAQCKVQENLDLFRHVRDNVMGINNSMTTMRGMMSHMPPLPVQLNEQLANVVLGALANGLSGPPNGLGGGNPPGMMGPGGGNPNVMAPPGGGGVQHLSGGGGQLPAARQMSR